MNCCNKIKVYFLFYSNRRLKVSILSFVVNEYVNPKGGLVVVVYGCLNENVCLASVIVDNAKCVKQ